MPLFRLLTLPLFVIIFALLIGCDSDNSAYSNNSSNSNSPELQFTPITPTTPDVPTISQPAEQADNH